MKKLIGAVVVSGIVLTSILWVANRDDMPSSSTDRTGGSGSMMVVTTFYPLQELAKSVVGNLGEVQAIVPAGSEPHDFEPSSKDIQALYEADLVIINGAGIDPWAEKVIPDLKERGVAVLVLAQSVDLLSGGATHDPTDEVGHTEEEILRQGEQTADMADESDLVARDKDPHFWLDPVIMASLVRDITRVLVERFPAHQVELAANGDAVTKKFTVLDRGYAAGLVSCRLREVVTAHDAFGYLAKRYNFETHALSGLSPEAEPSVKHLAEIAAEVKAEGIKYIFFETLVSPKLSETIAREVGAETLVFNPIEGVTAEEQAAGVNYFSLMEANLAALRKALECT